MNDFEQVLDDSLKQIASGAATADECLAQITPNIQLSLSRFWKRQGELSEDVRWYPSDAYKQRARGQLTEHIQDILDRNRRKPPLIWTVAISLAVLVIAFFVTGTALAQSALPGQLLYDWKLSSEQIWRASSPDRVGVDLELARQADLRIDRCIFEPYR